MRLRRSILPVLLLAGALASGGGAAAIEVGAQGDAEPLGGPRPTTPVLSARRVPSVVAAPVADRRLRGDLAAWAGSAHQPSCAVVLDARGQVVLDHHGDEPMVPASTLKLLTATAALEALGADHTYRTVVVGPPPEGGVVRGDLTLVGGGDPVLVTEDYAARSPRQPQVHTSMEALADALVSAGVTRVEGSIVGDESRYDQQRYLPVWPARYIDQNQTGPLSALSVNDGFAEYPTPQVHRDLRPAPDPAAHAAGVLTLLLAARGVEVVGPPRSGAAPAGEPELAAVESPPLAEIVRQLLQESDNTTAELLVKELGAQAGDPTTAGGLRRLVEVLGAAGLDLTGAAITDGSGLSTENRVPCRLVLQALVDPETGPLLRERLAVAGESGTLWRSFLDTSLVGHLRGKTGRLNAVASLAGTVVDDDGELAFAYLANDPDGLIDVQAVVSTQATLAQILLSWPQTPDVTVLGPEPVEPAPQGTGPGGDR